MLRAKSGSLDFARDDSLLVGVLGRDNFARGLSSLTLNACYAGRSGKGTASVAPPLGLARGGFAGLQLVWYGRTAGPSTTLARFARGAAVGMTEVVTSRSSSSSALCLAAWGKHKNHAIGMLRARSRSLGFARDDSFTVEGRLFSRFGKMLSIGRTCTIVG